MKYQLTIYVMAQPDSVADWSVLAHDQEPSYEFGSLADVVEYLEHLVEGTDDDQFKEYVEQVRREGVAVERALAHRGKKRKVTIKGTVDTAREAAAKRNTVTA